MPKYFECYTCDKTFPAGRSARDNHCRSTGHSAPDFECDSCPKSFGSERARDQHMNDRNHFYWECSKCDEMWPDQESCTQHEVEEHYYCSECCRTFQNLNNIRMHLKSQAHLGQTIPCPFCKKRFTTATGVAHHLEYGACPNAPHLNRDEIYRFVRSRDSSGVITKNLIEWYGTPSYTVDSRSWNGSAYECYLCHRSFHTLGALNQHINSPVNQQNFYHCPQRGCGVEFKTLASFINHLESESCGFMRFKAVQDNVGNLIRTGRLIGY